MRDERCNETAHDYPPLADFVREFSQRNRSEHERQAVYKIDERQTSRGKTNFPRFQKQENDRQCPHAEHKNRPDNKNKSFVCFEKSSVEPRRREFSGACAYLSRALSRELCQWVFHKSETRDRAQAHHERNQEKRLIAVIQNRQKEKRAERADRRAHGIERTMQTERLAVFGRLN